MRYAHVTEAPTMHSRRPLSPLDAARGNDSYVVVSRLTNASEESSQKSPPASARLLHGSVPDQVALLLGASDAPAHSVLSPKQGGQQFWLAGAAGLQKDESPTAGTYRWGHDQGQTPPHATCQAEPETWKPTGPCSHEPHQIQASRRAVGQDIAPVPAHAQLSKTLPAQPNPPLETVRHNGHTAATPMSRPDSTGTMPPGAPTGPCAEAPRAGNLRPASTATTYAGITAAPPHAPVPAEPSFSFTCVSLPQADCAQQVHEFNHLHAASFGQHIHPHFPPPKPSPEFNLLPAPTQRKVAEVVSKLRLHMLQGACAVGTDATAAAANSAAAANNSTSEQPQHSRTDARKAGTATVTAPFGSRQPAQAVVMAGLPGSGKSTILLHAAAGVLDHTIPKLAGQAGRSQPQKAQQAGSAASAHPSGRVSQNTVQSRTMSLLRPPAWQHACYVDLQHANSTEAACKQVFASLGAKLTAPPGAAASQGWRATLMSWLHAQHAKAMQCHAEQGADVRFNAWWGLLLDNADGLEPHALLALVKELAGACPTMQIIVSCSTWQEAPTASGTPVTLSASSEAEAGNAAASTPLLQQYKQPISQASNGGVAAASGATPHAGNTDCRSSTFCPERFQAAARLQQPPAGDVGACAEGAANHVQVGWVTAERLERDAAWSLFSRLAGTADGLAEDLCTACAGLPGPLVMLAELCRTGSVPQPQALQRQLRQVSRCLRQRSSAPSRSSNTAHANNHNARVLSRLPAIDEAAANIRSRLGGSCGQVMTIQQTQQQTDPAKEAQRIQAEGEAAKKLCDLVLQAALASLPEQVVCALEALSSYRTGWCDIRAAKALLEAPTCSQVQITGDAEQVLSTLVKLQLVCFHPGQSVKQSRRTTHMHARAHGPRATHQTDTQSTAGGRFISMGGESHVESEFAWVFKAPQGSGVDASCSAVGPVISVKASVMKQLREVLPVGQDTVNAHLQAIQSGCEQVDGLQPIPAVGAPQTALRAEARLRGLSAALAGIPWLSSPAATAALSNSAHRMPRVSEHSETSVADGVDVPQAGTALPSDDAHTDAISARCSMQKLQLGDVGAAENALHLGDAGMQQSWGAAVVGSPAQLAAIHDVDMAGIGAALNHAVQVFLHDPDWQPGLQCMAECLQGLQHLCEDYFTSVPQIACYLPAATLLQLAEAVWEGRSVLQQLMQYNHLSSLLTALALWAGQQDNKMCASLHARLRLLLLHINCTTASVHAETLMVASTMDTLSQPITRSSAVHLQQQSVGNTVHPGHGDGQCCDRVPSSSQQAMESTEAQGHSDRLTPLERAIAGDPQASATTARCAADIDHLGGIRQALKHHLNVHQELGSIAMLQDEGMQQRQSKAESMAAAMQPYVHRLIQLHGHSHAYTLAGLLMQGRAILSCTAWHASHTTACMSLLEELGAKSDAASSITEEQLDQGPACNRAPCLPEQTTSPHGCASGGCNPGAPAASSYEGASEKKMVEKMPATWAERQVWGVLETITLRLQQPDSQQHTPTQPSPEAGTNQAGSTWLPAGGFQAGASFDAAAGLEAGAMRQQAGDAAAAHLGAACLTADASHLLRLASEAHALLAEVRGHQGCWSQAAEHWQACLRLWSNVAGYKSNECSSLWQHASHPHQMHVQHQVLCCLCAGQCWTAAEALARQLLEQQAAACGLYHVATMRAMLELAATLLHVNLDGSSLVMDPPLVAGQLSSWLKDPMVPDVPARQLAEAAAQLDMAGLLLAQHVSPEPVAETTPPSPASSPAHTPCHTTSGGNSAVSGTSINSGTVSSAVSSAGMSVEQEQPQDTAAVHMHTDPPSVNAYQGGAMGPVVLGLKAMLLRLQAHMMRRAGHDHQALQLLQTAAACCVTAVQSQVTLEKQPQPLTHQALGASIQPGTTTCSTARATEQNSQRSTEDDLVADEHHHDVTTAFACCDYSAATSLYGSQLCSMSWASSQLASVAAIHVECTQLLLGTGHMSEAHQLCDEAIQYMFASNKSAHVSAAAASQLLASLQISAGHSPAAFQLLSWSLHVTQRHQSLLSLTLKAVTEEVLTVPGYCMPVSFCQQYGFAELPPCDPFGPPSSLPLSNLTPIPSILTAQPPSQASLGGTYVTAPRGGASVTAEREGDASQGSVSTIRPWLLVHAVAEGRLHVQLAGLLLQQANQRDGAAFCAASALQLCTRICHVIQLCHNSQIPLHCYSTSELALGALLATATLHAAAALEANGHTYDAGLQYQQVRVWPGVGRHLAALSLLGQARCTWAQPGGQTLGSTGFSLSPSGCLEQALQSLLIQPQPQSHATQGTYKASSQPDNAMSDPLRGQVQLTACGAIRQLQYSTSHASAPEEEYASGSLLAELVSYQARECQSFVWLVVAQLMDGMARLWLQADSPTRAAHAASLAADLAAAARSLLHTPQSSILCQPFMPLPHVVLAACMAVCQPHDAPEPTRTLDGIPSSTLNMVSDINAAPEVARVAVFPPSSACSAATCMQLSSSLQLLAESQAAQGRLDAAEALAQLVIPWHETGWQGHKQIQAGAHIDSVGIASGGHGTEVTMAPRTARLYTWLGNLVKLQVHRRSHALQYLQQASASLSAALGADDEEVASLRVDVGELLVQPLHMPHVVTKSPASSPAQRQAARDMLLSAIHILKPAYTADDPRVARAVLCLAALSLHMDQQLLQAEALADQAVEAAMQLCTLLGLPLPPHHMAQIAQQEQARLISCVDLDPNLVAAIPIASPAHNNTNHLSSGHHMPGTARSPGTPLSKTYSKTGFLALYGQPSSNSCGSVQQPTQLIQSCMDGQDTGAWCIPSAALSRANSIIPGSDALSNHGSGATCKPGVYGLDVADSAGHELRQKLWQQQNEAWLAGLAWATATGLSCCMQDFTKQAQLLKSLTEGGHAACDETQQHRHQQQQTVEAEEDWPCAEHQSHSTHVGQPRDSAEQRSRLRMPDASMQDATSMCERSGDSWNNCWQYSEQMQANSTGTSSRKAGTRSSRSVKGASFSCRQGSGQSQARPAPPSSQGPAQQACQDVSHVKAGLPRLHLAMMLTSARTFLLRATVQEALGRKQASEETFSDALWLYQGLLTSSNCTSSGIPSCIPTPEGMLLCEKPAGTVPAASWFRSPLINEALGWEISEALAGQARALLAMSRTACAGPHNRGVSMPAGAQPPSQTMNGVLDVLARVGEEAVQGDGLVHDMVGKGISLAALSVGWAGGSPVAAARAHAPEAIHLLREAMRLALRCNHVSAWHMNQIAGLQCDLALALSCLGDTGSMSEAEGLARRALAAVTEQLPQASGMFQAISEADVQLVLSTVLCADAQACREMFISQFGELPTPALPEHPVVSGNTAQATSASHAKQSGGILQQNASARSHAALLAWLSGVVYYVPALADTDTQLLHSASAGDGRLFQGSTDLSATSISSYGGQYMDEAAAWGYHQPDIQQKGAFSYNGASPIKNVPPLGRYTASGTGAAGAVHKTQLAHLSSIHVRCSTQGPGTSGLDGGVSPGNSPRGNLRAAQQGDTLVVLGRPGAQVRPSVGRRLLVRANTKLGQALEAAQRAYILRYRAMGGAMQLTVEALAHWAHVMAVYGQPWSNIEVMYRSALDVLMEQPDLLSSTSAAAGIGRSGRSTYNSSTASPLVLFLLTDASVAAVRGGAPEVATRWVARHMTVIENSTSPKAVKHVALSYLASLNARLMQLSRGAIAPSKDALNDVAVNMEAPPVAQQQSLWRRWLTPKRDRARSASPPRSSSRKAAQSSGGPLSCFFGSPPPTKSHASRSPAHVYGMDDSTTPKKAAGKHAGKQSPTVQHDNATFQPGSSLGYQQADAHVLLGEELDALWLDVVAASDHQRG